jgi:hypothetical protein
MKISAADVLSRYFSDEDVDYIVEQIEEGENEVELNGYLVISFDKIPQELARRYENDDELLCSSCKYRMADVLGVDYRLVELAKNEGATKALAYSFNNEQLLELAEHMHSDDNASQLGRYLSDFYVDGNCFTIFEI